jgi:type I restriction enzyme S subunit
MLPSGWKISTLKSVVSKIRKITYGIVVPGPEDPFGNFMIRAQDYSKGWVHSSNIFRVGHKVDESYKRSRVNSGDVLLTIVGSIGNTAKVPEELDGANLTQQTARLSFDDNIADYYLSVLRSDIGKKQIYRYAKSGVQPSLNLGDVEKFEVPVPPIPEQKKIAQILSTWDKAINTTEQLIANSLQQKKALMQQLLTGKKRLLDENGVRFSGEWEKVEIGRVMKEVKRPVDWDDDAEYNLLSVKRRSEGVVLREALKGSDILTKKMNIAHSGDFLISKMQIVHGAAGLVPDEFHGFHISDSYISLISKDDSKLSIHFFAWFAKQKLMYHKAFLCSYGVHIEKMTFNFNLFLKEKIKVPISIEEQQKIASVLSSADREIELLRSKLTALKQEKKALMQQLLTGKRRVKVD